MPHATTSITLGDVIEGLHLHFDHMSLQKGQNMENALYNVTTPKTFTLPFRFINKLLIIALSNWYTYAKFTIISWVIMFYIIVLHYSA